MSLHINANKQDIAKIVLMPGDPNRAKWIADNYLRDVIKIENERRMTAYTGYTKHGTRVTVMPSGMGMPSMGIYATELYYDYDVDTIIRVGTSGAYQEDINLKDILIATSVSTDSSLARHYGLYGDTFSPCADVELLFSAVRLCKENKIPYHAGNVLCSDVFYDDNKDYYKKWARLNVLGVEMESYALYSIAAKFRKKALAIFSVSDHFVKDEHLDKPTRSSGLKQMIELAIDIVG